ncbi:hypothetical protein BYT27DRAFT_7208627 [Phlegmacium glaucopus]|nr:hypothetical protein BYT27DRAFT_7208627 [Phlegmacium glaucopus]
MTKEVPVPSPPQLIIGLRSIRVSPSPPPPSTALPFFLPSENAGNAAGSKEKEPNDRFRQFWMTLVADGFKDDLKEIRKFTPKNHDLLVGFCVDVVEDHALLHFYSDLLFHHLFHRIDTFSIYGLPALTTFGKSWVISEKRSWKIQKLMGATEPNARTASSGNLRNTIQEMVQGLRGLHIVLSIRLAFGWIGASSISRSAHFFPSYTSRLWRLILLEPMPAIQSKGKDCRSS